MSNTNENLHCFMDDSEQIYLLNHKVEFKRTLEKDLDFIQFVNEHDDLELDPNSDLAKLEHEMAKYGLKITPETDIKQLAETVRLLGIA